MTTIKERLTEVEVYVAEYGKEIDSLRISRHEHGRILQAIPKIEESVKELTTAVTKVTGIVNKMVWMSLGGMAVGGVLLTVLGYMFYIGYSAVKVLLGAS